MAKGNSRDEPRESLWRPNIAEQERSVSAYTCKDGIRTSETTDEITREFLIDPHNPTGYGQILQVATDGRHGRAD